MDKAEGEGHRRMRTECKSHREMWRREEREKVDVEREDATSQQQQKQRRGLSGDIHIHFFFHPLFSLSLVVQ